MVRSVISETLGNTKESRSRNWCFTLNNYSREEIDAITKFSKCKYLFQEETGESGTPHLQGTLQFKDAKTLSKLKKLLPRGHLEVCKDLKGALIYCCKEDSRTGEIYSNFDYSKFTQKTHVKKTVEEIQYERLSSIERGLAEARQDASIWSDPMWERLLPMPTSFSNEEENHEWFRRQYG